MKRWRTDSFRLPASAEPSRVESRPGLDQFTAVSGQGMRGSTFRRASSAAREAVQQNKRVEQSLLRCLTRAADAVRRLGEQRRQLVKLIEETEALLSSR